GPRAPDRGAHWSPGPRQTRPRASIPTSHDQARALALHHERLEGGAGAGALHAYSAPWLEDGAVGRADQMLPVLRQELVRPQIEGRAGVGAAVDIGAVTPVHVDDEALHDLAAALESELRGLARERRADRAAPRAGIFRRRLHESVLPEGFRRFNARRGRLSKPRGRISGPCSPSTRKTLRKPSGADGWAGGASTSSSSSASWALTPRPSTTRSPPVSSSGSPSPRRCSMTPRSSSSTSRPWASTQTSPSACGRRSPPSVASGGRPSS